MSSRSSVARRVSVGLTVLAAGAVLAGCGAAATSSSVPAASAAAGTHAGAAPAAGTALRTIDGSTVRVPGSMPSVLVFLSIGCADCSAAAKTVAQAARSVGDKASFLGVDLDPGVPPQDLRSFLAAADAQNLPTVIDAKAALTAKYQVTALSSVLVVDPAGKVTYRAVNPTANAITAAVAQSS